MPRISNSGADHARPETLEHSVDHLLEECRMVLPGVQALFGFQLIAVFNRPFLEILSGLEQVMHLIALVLVSLAVTLLMAPAAYHRQVEPEMISRSFVQYAGSVLMLAMIPLMLALPFDVYLIARVVLQREMPVTLVASALLIVFAVVWFGILWRLRTMRGRRWACPIS